MIHFMRLRRDLKFLSHHHWPVDRLNNVSGSPVRPDLWPVLPVRIWWSIRPVWLWPVWSMIHCQLWDYRATTVQTSASARRISSKRWGGSYNYAQAQHPAPFSRATSPSLIVCLYLASSKLLKLEINMHHLRMAMQYRQAVNPLSEFGEILCRWAWIRRCFLLSKIWTLYV